MAESVNTHYLRGGFAVSDDIELARTPRTRTIFRPGLHSGGVRGRLIRQKIGENGEWKDINEVNFNSLSPDAAISIDLDTEAIKKLYEKLCALYEVQRQKGTQLGDQSYIIAKESEALVIPDSTKRRAIKGLLAKGYTQDFWRELICENPDLASQLATSRIQQDREHAIGNFESSLGVYKHDEEYWQNFFTSHPWMLQSAFAAPVFMLRGETYVGGKTAQGRQGGGGVATDFLFADESTKSFSVVEIKTPGTRLVAAAPYRGTRHSGFDNEIYSMHVCLSGAIVQTRNQISVAVNDFQTALHRSYSQIELNHVHPKGVLVIGSRDDLTQRQIDSFNHFRQGLHGMNVVTFDELLKRLQLLFQ